MAFTLDDVAKIERAIKSGALRVTYADRTVQYNGISDLMRARQEMLDEIAQANGTKRRRTFRATQTGTGL